MKGRCLSESYHHWAEYGGRGITICDRWLGERGFENFLADMDERPDGKTLDRIDNEGNYEPGNCRWATPSQQAKNRRRPRNHPKMVLDEGRVLEVRGLYDESWPPKDIAAAYGVSVDTIRNIGKRQTWADVPELAASAA